MVSYSHISARVGAVVFELMQLTSTDSVAVGDAIVQKLKTGIAHDATLASCVKSDDWSVCVRTLFEGFRVFAERTTGEVRGFQTAYEAEAWLDAEFPVLRAQSNQHSTSVFISTGNSP